MTNKELISKVAATAAMTKTKAEELLNATSAVMQKNLLNGKKIYWQNIGTLETKQRSARTIALPKSGAKTQVPEKLKLVFTANESLKNTINGK